MKMRARRSLFLRLTLWSCIYSLASCAAATASPPLFTVQQYPKTDGSISTQPLATLIACRLTHTSFDGGEIMTEIMPDMTRTLYPTTDSYEPDKRFSLEKKIKSPGPPENIKLELWEKIRHTNTHPSHVNLIQRKLELIIAAREPSDDEIVLARQNGVEIKTLPIARDALVFIVNASNPVESLSIEQIRNIYTGKFTSWADLGWQGDRINWERIIPYRRNRNSGSEEKMQKLVMKGLPVIAADSLLGGSTTLGFMYGPFNALRQDKGGLGYTPYYYERYMAKTPEVKIVAINNLMPSQETISNGTYSLVTEVVVAYLSDLAKESPAAKIRDWLLTAEGQEVVAESGYIPIKK